MTTHKSLVPSEPVDLPSKGWFYDSSHPLSTGQIDIYLLTTSHEDILTSTNLIMKGIVIDRLLEALIATPGVKYGDLLVGDRNAVIIAARILGYGKMYPATFGCPECGKETEQEINLEDLKNTNITFKPEQKGKNEFIFNLPFSKKNLVFKLLTQHDEQIISKELEGLKKISKSDVNKGVTTRMRHSILSVDGDTDGNIIKSVVDNMPARDAMAFREYVKIITPDVDMNVHFECSNCNFDGMREVPIDHKFFWPDIRI